MENYHEPSQIISNEEIEQLSEVFLRVWDEYTAHQSVQDKWSSSNKALGQCAVTALVVNKIYGGDILDDNNQNHMWNLLPDGSQQDFSRAQFLRNQKIVITSTKSRDDVLNSNKAKLAKTPERYELMRSRINALTDKYNL